MPIPRPNETREEFVERCIPSVIEDGTAESPEQAIAVCNSLWEQGGKAVPEKYSHIDFTPPQRAQQNYTNGLKRHENGETGDGLEAITVRMARHFAEGGAATPEWARKGNRWWGRNERFADEEPGTPAYASAQLWGGYNWFAPIVKQMDRADEESKMTELASPPNDKAVNLSEQVEDIPSTKEGRVFSEQNAQIIVSSLLSIMEMLEEAGIDIPGWGRTADELEGEMDNESEDGGDGFATYPQIITVQSVDDPIATHQLEVIGPSPHFEIVSAGKASAEPPIEFTDDGDPLIAFGGTVKALGDGRVGGYLIVFTDENNPDLENEFFNSKTDFAIGDEGNSLVFFHHGLDPNIGKKRLTLDPARLKVDDFGVWVEAQLALRDEYEQWIYERAQQNKMGWSSGTAPNLAEIVPRKNGTWWIKTWPLGLDASITPTPAEPKAQVMPLKMYAKTLDDLSNAEGPQREGAAMQIEVERQRNRLLRIL